METLDGHFAAVQIQGRRDYQEDDYGLLENRRTDGDSEHTVIVVADGMGGHVGGSRASSLVTETFIDTYQQLKSAPVTQRLKSSLEAAHAAVQKDISDNPDYENMGTTLICAVIEEGIDAQKSLRWLSVGDSLLFLYREGRLTRLNADHSMVPVLEELVRKGKMSPEAAATDPNRHGLLSAVSAGKIEMLDLPDSPVELEEGDLVLLASDGILTLSDERIAAVLGDSPNASVQEKVQSLVYEIERQDRPGQDNVTIALYSPFVSAVPAAVAPAGNESNDADTPEAATEARGLTGRNLLIAGCVLFILALLLVL